MLTPGHIKIFAEEISLSNRYLASESKTKLKQIIWDVIYNLLSIKIGFDKKIDKLFDIGRQQDFETKPLKKEFRESVDVKINDVVFVCTNNEKPYVTCPSLIIDKYESSYLIFYLTNLIGNKETKLIPINDFNFGIVDKKSIGRNRTQAIENKMLVD